MSEEVPNLEPIPEAEPPLEEGEEVVKEQKDLDMGRDYVSPLHTMLTEIHEVYQELLLVGFPKSIAAQIVAHMIQDAMMYRSVEEDDDDMDLEDESDEDDDRRFE